jgi:hypothetical protein
VTECGYGKVRRGGGVALQLDESGGLRRRDELRNVRRQPNRIDGADEPMLPAAAQFSLLLYLLSPLFFVWDVRKRTNVSSGFVGALLTDLAFFTLACRTGVSVPCVLPASESPVSARQALASSARLGEPDLLRDAVSWAVHPVRRPRPRGLGVAVHFARRQWLHPRVRKRRVHSLCTPRRGRRSETRCRTRPRGSCWP